MKAAKHGPSEPLLVAVQRGHMDRAIEIVDKFLVQKSDALTRANMLEEVQDLREQFELMKVSKNRQ